MVKRDYYDSLCRLIKNEEPNTLDTEHTLRYKSFTLWRNYDC